MPLRIMSPDRTSVATKPAVIPFNTFDIATSQTAGPIVDLRSTAVLVARRLEPLPKVHELERALFDRCRHPTTHFAGCCVRRAVCTLLRDRRKFWTMRTGAAPGSLQFAPGSLQFI